MAIESGSEWGALDFTSSRVEEKERGIADVTSISGLGTCVDGGGSH